MARVAAMTLLVVVLSLVLLALDLSTMPPIPPFMEGFATQMVWASWLPWIVGAPLLGFVGVRFRLRVGGWYWVLLAHVAASALMIVLCQWFQEWLAPAPPSPFSEENPFAFLLPKMEPEPMVVPISAYLQRVVPIYLSLGGCVQAAIAFWELKDRRVSEASLQAALSESRLAQLRMQINPHFLFNTLNSVNALMGSDVERARTMLADLSALLRASFQESERTLVELGTELDLVRRYVDIQRVRFGERLRFEVFGAGGFEGVLVPGFCLQPLIENSIVHGFEKSREEFSIEIRIAESSGKLLIEVLDRGGGQERREELGQKEGVGLGNVRERWLRLYGEQGKVETDSRANGFRVALTFPLDSERRDV